MRRGTKSYLRSSFFHRLVLAGLWLFCIDRAFSAQGPGADNPEYIIPVMKNLPIHNQGQGGTCYSSAASLVYDVLLRKSGMSSDGHTTSPVMASLDYSAKINNNSGAGQSVVGLVSNGYFCDALKEIHKAGSCNRRVLEENQEVFQKKDSTEVLEQLEKFMAISKQQARSRELSFTCSLNRNLYLAMAKNFSQALPEALKERGLKSVYTLANVQCLNHRIKLARPPKCRAYDSLFKSERKFSQNLFQKVKSNPKVPVAITYCSQLLVLGKSYKTSFALGLPASNCSMHISLIMGHRKNSQGIRQYLIRNSWGPNAVYHKDWENSGGDIWVDESALIKSSTIFEVVN